MYRLMSNGFSREAGAFGGVCKISEDRGHNPCMGRCAKDVEGWWLHSEAT